MTKGEYWGPIILFPRDPPSPKTPPRKKQVRATRWRLAKYLHATLTTVNRLLQELGYSVPKRGELLSERQIEQVIALVRGRVGYCRERRTSAVARARLKTELRKLQRKQEAQSRPLVLGRPPLFVFASVDGRRIRDP